MFRAAVSIIGMRADEIRAKPVLACRRDLNGVIVSDRWKTLTGWGLMWLVMLTLFLINAGLPVVHIGSGGNADPTIHDIMVPLAAGWATLQGAVPHIDLHGPTGGVYNIIFGIAMGLTGDARMITYAEIIIGLITALLATGLLAPRLPWHIGAFIGLFCAMFAMAPNDYGVTSAFITHLAQYNRFSIAIAMLLMLAAVLPLRGGAAESWHSILPAMVGFGLLYETKITVALCAAAFYGAVLLLLPARRWFVLIAGCGIPLAALIAEILVPGYTMAYAADLIDSAKASSNVVTAKHNQLSYRLLDTLKIHPFEQIQLLLVILIGAGCKIAHRRGGLSHSLLPVIVMALGALTIAQNFRHNNIFLIAAAALVMLDVWHLTYLKPQILRALRILSALSFGGLVLPYFAADLTGFGFNIVRSRTDAPDQARMSDDPANPLYAMVVRRAAESPYCALPEQPKRQYFTGSDYADFIEDGRRLLLRETGGGNARVVAIQFTNPFPLVLRQPPAQGDYLWLDPQRTVSHETLGPPSKLLGNADYVMVPKKGNLNLGIADYILRGWGADFTAEFTKLSETNCWTLYAPKPR